MQPINQVVELHAMLDIETLSTDSNAFITSICLQTFNPNKKGVTDEPVFVDMYDPWAEQEGAHIDPNTIKWRQRQAEISKAELRRRPNEYSDLKDSLTRLAKFVEEHNVKIVWANSPSFDCTIINNAARRLIGKTIFPYYAERDVRTVKQLLEVVLDRSVELNNNHLSITDALNQIELVQLLYGHIEVYKIERRTKQSCASSGGLSDHGNASGAVSQSERTDQVADNGTAVTENKNANADGGRETDHREYYPHRARFA